MTTKDDQIRLEEENLRSGAETYLRKANEKITTGREAETAHGIILLKKLLQPMADDITAYVAESASRRGPRPLILTVYNNLEPETIAYLTLRLVLNLINGSTTRTSMALGVAKTVEDEMRFRAFQDENSEAFEKAAKSVRTSHRGHKKKALAGIAYNEGVEWEHWSTSFRLQVGTHLLDCLRRSTGLIEYKMIYKRKDVGVWHVLPTQETVEWIAKFTDEVKLHRPVYSSMIVPPKPWTTPYDGGYLSGAMKLTLVKTKNRNYLEELSNVDMSGVYASINALQETAWMVNPHVLETLQEVWDKDLKVGKVPHSTADPIPAPPFQSDDSAAVEAWKLEHPEAWLAWRRQAHEAYSNNSQMRSRRISVWKALQTAREFSEYPAIYFPHQMDFRGRAYPVSTHLNPQGADYVKALLQFGEGKPINDGVAAGWLAVHGANCFGEDKVSLDDRIAWVFENEERILSVAENPFGNAWAWWTGADKPWQFLAFCFDWRGFHDGGYGYVSHLPVALDGSCNGLQHFSALLRDQQGGKAVNLVPQELPADVYAMVATKTIELIRSNDVDNEEFAAKWLSFGIDRKITKRAVMTLPYGSTQFGTKMYVVEAARERAEKVGYNPFREGDTDETFQACIWLNKRIWEAIAYVIRSAREAMDWLRSAATLVAKEDLPVTWSTPDGFFVEQRYPETKEKRVKTILDGELCYLTLREELQTLDRRKQRSGISPNFVHSLDACHMRVYVNLALENDITAFALVHDSYGTHAADAEMMSRCLRAAFVDMYDESDVLSTFRDEITRQLSGTEPEELPNYGDLDIREVLESDFFFA